MQKINIQAGLFLNENLKINDSNDVLNNKIYKFNKPSLKETSNPEESVLFNKKYIPNLGLSLTDNCFGAVNIKDFNYFICANKIIKINKYTLQKTDITLPITINQNTSPDLRSVSQACADNRYIYIVSSEAASKILKFDTVTENVVQTANLTQGGPITQVYKIIYVANTLWITCTNNNCIIRLDTNLNTLSSITAALNGPRGIAFDGANVWVCNTNANTVIKYSTSATALVTISSLGISPLDCDINWETNQLILNSSPISSPITRISLIGIDITNNTVTNINAYANNISYVSWDNLKPVIFLETANVLWPTTKNFTRCFFDGVNYNFYSNSTGILTERANYD